MNLRNEFSMAVAASYNEIARKRQARHKLFLALEEVTDRHVTNENLTKQPALDAECEAAYKAWHDAGVEITTLEILYREGVAVR